MRKGELLINYIIMLGPLVIGLGVVWAMELATKMPHFAFGSMVLSFVLGFALFAKAKLSVIKLGHLFTFGSGLMSKSNRTAYYLGYSGMSFSFLLLLGFALTKL